MTKKDKLYCPVRRLEKPGVDISIGKGKDNLININTNIKVKDIITPTIEEYYIKFKEIMNRK